MNKAAYKADALLLLAAFIWGTAFVAQRVGMQYLGPFAFNSIRYGLAALALFPFVRKQNGPKVPIGGLWAGLVMFAGATLQQAGIVYTTAGKAGFITALYVILVPLIGFFVHQKAGWNAWAGAFLAVTGLYCLSVTDSHTIAYGDLLVLIGAIFWAVHILIIGRFSPKTEPFRLACTQFGVVAVLSLIAALPTESITSTAIQGAALPILYGGFLSIGVGFTLQVIAQQNAPSAHAAIIMSLETVFAALSGWAILDEFLNQRELVGCAFVLAGMLVTQLFPRAKKGLL